MMKLKAILMRYIKLNVLNGDNFVVSKVGLECLFPRQRDVFYRNYQEMLSHFGKRSFNIHSWMSSKWKYHEEYNGNK